ncbi:IucA/IucC family siderophore biosynthesis protein [Alkalihalobacillus sp. AL-G]|uniref:IucA/IucC family protein n=1 Tax=Alkalihalobacillus sp. AL-G TaxID=2926399 RepID=UPI00272CC849|nr:IucA/IucC family protein [Alkalihalobacillus sp. AL-G]WLD92623.1 IucA/IucC family siderophore biosynthesis protein [Alkalihalobacillus sp. AL-G]
MNMLTETVKINTSSELHKEERQCLQFLQEHHPQLVSYYLNVLNQGRKGVLHKLAASLLREDIIGLYSKSITMKKIGSVLVIGFEGLNESWKGLLRQLQQQNLREEISYRIYRLDQQLLVFPIEKEFAFGRMILTDDILLIKEKRVQIVETAGELLSMIAHKLPRDVQNLQSELDNGTGNYLLALSYLEQWKQEVQKEAEGLNVKTSTEYARVKNSQDTLWSSSLFFEQLSTEGHHLHPGAKTKTGMSPCDVFRFSPEFHQLQLIRFVAVKRDKLIWTGDQPDYIESAFPEIMNDYELAMRKSGLNPEKYLILPVHEWQYEHAIPSIYSFEIENREIIFLDDITIQGSPSSSFRTIWPKVTGKPALKLAINSQMTSTVRSISTQTAMNSVTFTNMMKQILEREPTLDKFQPINEVAGYSFRSHRTDQSRNLTVVVRESLDGQLQQGELAIAGCSLYNSSPVSGKTILSELVDEYCCHQGLDMHQGAVSFLEDYLSIIIPGYLTLMVKYGVALEGHLQNSVPVFKNGQLVRFYFRDWGGSRIFLERLHQQDIKPEFYPDSVSVTDRETDMWNKIYYTVFQNHLGEFIVQLCQYSELSEGLLWEKVRNACDESFKSLLSQDIYSSKKDSERLYKPCVEHKALTKMRLYPDHGYCYSTVPNPLSNKEESAWKK